MRIATVHEGAELLVCDVCCDAGPQNRPYIELHRCHSLSFVRRGSFGYRTLGRTHELVAGAVMVGVPGQEYMATHEHHGSGDECVSVKLFAALAESLGKALWREARVPPLAQVGVLGALLQAAIEGRTAVGADEVALLLAAKLAATVGDAPARAPRSSARERSRAIETALAIDDDPAREAALEDLARAAGLSPFHFLRIFARVIGVTPHQYVVRSRLRRAARLLAEGGLKVTEVALEAGFADLSNFVRSFRRAAGTSPREFRRAARGERKIRQDRIAHAE